MLAVSKIVIDTVLGVRNAAALDGDDDVDIDANGALWEGWGGDATLVSVPVRNGLLRNSEAMSAARASWMGGVGCKASSQKK